MLAGAVSAATAAHVVKPKATQDDDRFDRRCCVLPDGAFLAYYVKAGSGPTLVLVPETHGDRTQFQEPALLEALDPNLRLVVIESRGQGRSWPPPTAAQASIEQYASDVLAVVKELQLRDWYVGGHSLGGMIALEIAGRRPDGLRGVISLEGWVHSRAQRLAFPERKPRSAEEQAEARRQREERYRSQRWSAEEYAALGKIWTAWDAGDGIIATTHYPVLSVWGDRGLTGPPDHAKLLLPKRSNIRVQWIPGADHYVTDPPFAAQVGAAITQFIRETTQPLAATSERPNIVVILADDLGYGDLGCYGGQARTPHLDRLAREGLKFVDFHSNGAVCSPTRAAFLTGRYQQRCGIVTALGENAKGLPADEKTIAEYLREAGYSTALFGKWHLGYHPENGPLKQGFEHFRGHLHGAFDYFSKVDQYGRLDWWHDDRVVSDDTYATELITKHAVDYVRSHARRPFFAFVAQSAIHFPWQAPGDAVHRRAGTRYEKLSGPNSKLGPHAGDVGAVVIAMIEALDQSVGGIVGALRELGLDRRTMVFFTSDNGGYLDYSGGYTNISSNGPLRGAKGSLYEGGHRVPGIAWWPGRIAPGRVVKTTTLSMDLAPTILELAGVELPSRSERAFDGVSIGPLLFAGREGDIRDLFWADARAQAVRRGPWKLLLEAKAPPQLYHLDDDIGESRNLAAQQPERVTALRAALMKWERSVRPATASVR